MTSVPSTQSTPQIIEQKLGDLRRKLTGWLTVHGLGRWLLIVCGLIAADIIIDRVFEMDFAQRIIMLVVMVAVAIYFFCTKVIKPLLTRMSDDALIYQVEQKNEGAGEQILASLQLARQTDFAATGTSPQLVDATIQSGVAKAEAIDFGKTLDQTQHKKDLGVLGGGAILLAVLAIGILATQFMGTWFSRNIMLTNRQWPQPTYLEIDGAVDGKMVLPLGSKHKQIVTITDDSAVTDVEVRLEVEGSSGNRTIYPMKRTGKLDGRERVFELNVTNEFRFRASSANGVTTDWIDVDYVEPPAIVDLKLEVTMPLYTGLDPEQLVGNGPHGVLEGSLLSITAKTNKRLQSAKLVAGGVETDISIPAGGARSFEIAVPGSDQSEPLAGGDYELKLADESGLENLRRSKFAITIKEDKAPKLRADLLGISGLVTPQATVPVSFQAIDDYGLNQMFFDCRWRVGDEETETVKQINFDGLPEERPAVSSKDVGVLQLETLPLQPGMNLRMTVSAEDTRPVEPNISASQEFLLRVVSQEELRADLLRREIEQRKAFEQIYQAQMELTAEIEAVAASDPQPNASIEKFHSQREAKMISMVRSQKGVGTSIDRIANRFEEFLVEVKNNRLDEAENELMPSQRIEKRFDEKIIRPIRRLDQDLISVATRNMDNCRRVEREQNELDVAVNQTIVVQREVLESMKKILDAMNNSETFQEILNEMLEVKRTTDSIGDGIDKIKANQTITDETEAGGIFDE